MNLAHMVVWKPKIVTAHCENPQDAKSLPHLVRISFEHIEEVDINGEARDALKVEVVEWLKDHATGRWDFFVGMGEPVTEFDPLTEQEGLSTPMWFAVRFKNWKDAFEFKIRWYGA